MPRKPKTAEGAKPAFPVDAEPGMSKQELAAVVITAGIFAGPYGKTILDSIDPHKYETTARTALEQYGVLLEMIRSAS